MRFAPEFSNMPQSIPAAVYKKAPLKKRKREKLPPATPNATQLELIKTIGKMLPLEMLHDPVIFPIEAVVLQGLASLSEEDAILYDFKVPFVAYVKDGRCVLRDADSGRVRCIGTTADLYHYASKYANRAFRAVRVSLDMGVIHGQFEGELWQILQQYRAERDWSTSLDKISKQDELEYLDQDHVITKFLLEPDEPRNDKVLHLGSGTVNSSSMRALTSHYSRVVCVDPRVLPSKNFIQGVFDFEKVKPGWDIISDIAIGDGSGMTVHNQKGLVEQLYGLAGPHRLVIAKIGLVRGIQARGWFRKKPRPHNLEVIVQLDPDGDPLDDLYDKWKPKIIAANKKRNERIFRHDFAGQLKQVYMGPDELRDLMVQQCDALPAPGPKLKLPASRNEMLVQQGGAKMGAERTRAWNDRCRNIKTFDLNGDHCLIHNRRFKQRRAIRLMDPGFADIEFSFNSVAATVIDRGLGLVFDREWCVV